MDTTNSDHRQKLKLLITESVDASIEDKMWCPSSLEIQDIGFRVARIEDKLDHVIKVCDWLVEQQK